MTRLYRGAQRASVISTARTFTVGLIGFIAGILFVSPLRAQTLAFTTIPDGFETASIALPGAFGGALGIDPNNDQILYCAIGGFGAMSLARVNLLSGQVDIVANGPFGAIAGIAPLPTGEIVVTDNAGAAGGPPDETALLLRDSRPRDGDFNDAGEIRELISPILNPAPGNWNGAHARLVPRRKGTKLKPGSVMIQTADGPGGSELLVIENPGKRPRYVTGPIPFFAGFDYNGGFDFDSTGRVIMGTLTGSFTGEVFALHDKNRNLRIDAGESNRMVMGEAGMADLVVDAEDDVLFAGYDGNFFAAIRTFDIPADPLTGAAIPGDFASTDGGFLSAILINSKKRPFEPGTGPFGATLVMSGFTGSFESATNLLLLRPASGAIFADAPFAVEAWPADDH